MLKQKPEIGERFVCNNGQEYTCCTLSDLTDWQQGVAGECRKSGRLGDIIGKLSTGSWMHWNSSIDGGDESFNWKIKKIYREFRPKIGDTIVTAERGNYICVPKGNYYGNADFYGKSAEDTEWSSWMLDGRTESEARSTSKVCQDIHDTYRVVEIIPANPVQPKETALEVRVRVLEKENAMLVRLLMKEGKL